MKLLRIILLFIAPIGLWIAANLLVQVSFFGMGLLGESWAEVRFRTLGWDASSQHIAFAAYAGRNWFLYTVDIAGRDLQKIAGCHPDDYHCEEAFKENLTDHVPGWISPDEKWSTSDETALTINSMGDAPKMYSILVKFGDMYPHANKFGVSIDQAMIVVVLLGWLSPALTLPFLYQLKEDDLTVYLKTLVYGWLLAIPFVVFMSGFVL